MDHPSDQSPSWEPTPPKPPTHSAGLSRSGTLSWQQRPSSRGSIEPGSRPTSRGAAVAHKDSEGADTANDPASDGREPSPSRRPISVQYKDSDFLRQTAERAMRSEAYRQTKDQGELSNSSLQSMAGRSSREKDRPVMGLPAKERAMMDEPPKSSPTKKSETTGTPLSGATKSPLPLTPAHRFEPLAPGETSPTRNTEQPFRASAMSPTQARMSQGLDPRPPSPTKGLGGFVQSAMMKRSDSLTRRDSARGSRPQSISNIRAVRDESDAKDDTVGRNVNPPSPDKANFLRREVPPEPLPKPTFAGANRSPMATNAEPPQHSKMDSPAEEPEKSQNLAKPKPSPLDAKPTSEVKGPIEPRLNPSTSTNKPTLPKSTPGASQRPAWMEELSKKKAARESENSAKGDSRPGSSGSKSGGVGLATAAKLPELSNDAQAPDFKGKHAQRPSEGSRFAPSASSSPRSSQFKSPDLESSSMFSRPSSLASKESPGLKQEPKKEPLQPSREKPAPPPKVDFRANLKSRQGPAESTNAAEPEFKNVFGKLKKTETKNYVAPDELKGNILRGKAGLALTGGPQKSARRDEFKESILQKKEAMKAGGGSVRGRSGAEAVQAAPVAAKSPGLASPYKPSTQPTGSKEGTQKTAEEIDDQSAAGSSNGHELTKSISIDAKKATESKAPEKEKEKLLPAKSATAPAASPVRRSEPKGGLADRFNANLAGILARGPPGGSSATMSTSPERSSSVAFSDNSESTEKGGSLTHATKSRARGPKRRPPTSTPAEGKSKSEATPRAQPSATASGDRREPKIIGPSKSSFSALTEARPASPVAQKGESSQGPDKGSSAKPVLSPKPTSPTPLSPKPDLASRMQDAARQVADATSESSGKQDTGSKPRSTSKLEITPKPETKGKPESSDPKAKILDASHRSPPMSPKSPNILSKNAASTSQPSRNGPQGLGISNSRGSSGNASSSLNLGPESSRKEPPKSPRSPKVPAKDLDKLPRSPRSPPVPAKDTEKLARIASNSSMAARELRSQPKLSEAKPTTATKEAKLIEQCFRDVHNVPFNTDVGTQSILSGQAVPGGKIRTLRKEIFAITGDGKRSPVPPHQEHLLFDNNMYLCTHVFGNEAGKRATEVYLWCGDGVSSSAVEDTQLFGRNAAKDAGGKLTILTQGKESSNFFEALGGIVVIRSGGPDSAPVTYMLRGRRHMGQIAFDEVTFTPKALCSGFPHIVATTNGTLYLWKGKGSNADELGCARLIGMDLGLTGEIEEIDEGSEPKAFWVAFTSAERPEPMAEHWPQKATKDNYRTRLFSIGDARPKSASSFIWNRLPGTPTSHNGSAAGIREISPYSQSDLARDGIFVLDTYFEIFM